MLGMRAQAPFGQGRPKVHRRRSPRAALFHPSALPCRIHLVGRVADDHGDRLIPLDRVRLFSRIADGGEHGGKPRLLGVGVAQGVGHIEARLRQVAPCPRARGRSPHQRPHFRHQPQLRHGEGAELQFEPDQPMCRSPQGWTNCPRALIIGDRLGDFAQHAEKEGAGARRGIGDGDILGGKALMAAEQRGVAQSLVRQADHGLHYLGRGVVAAGLLAQGVVVNLEEVFVEIEPSIGLALGQGRPMHLVQHAGQG